jgi:hypothetical protein
MPIHKAYEDVRKAFTELLTLDSIVEDKEEMEFLIDAFAKHVTLHSSEEEINARMQSPEELLRFFKEYLDHLSDQLYTKAKK